MSTYRAVEVAADGSLRLAERPLVEPAPGHVRVKVEACGVCHTDAFTVHPRPESEPARVPGHEIAGRIDALGEGVTGWNIGDRAGIGFLGGHDGVCNPCRRGDFAGCENQPVTGVSVDGGYAEYAYARESGLVRLPEQLSAVAAAPLLCAGFTTYNALLKAGVRGGSLVAVQGIGGLGHLGVQYARRMGAQVVAIARGTDKEPLARQLGAHHFLDSTAGDLGDRLKELGGADVILATAASGSSMTPLIPGLARGGTLMVVGASEEPIEVSPVALLYGTIRVTGLITGSAIENEDNLRFAVDQSVAAMIEQAPLADAAAAYDRMMSGKARFRVVLTMT
ncbi:alcohol dehydrogenase catalytic domain-containing protein [Catellatospora tritici]|uniref:alcohol dehydrogenase catalytic domain-containing protein n=1 Tax=Catellatospora tritici TaxID=2851566 RepID=UPI001C2D842F|nr:alcohol dehydrogenase catalytic domain-containing protein [Catellatospora tritici]MBV1854384.1 alcohol dehydrogenase catalytic domain-containing protein [Catellatospora tritici]